MPNLAQSFGLLVEGLAGAFYPEVAYVRQGAKVLFYQGRPELTESLGGGVTIVESEDDLEMAERTVGEGDSRITERTVKNGEWFVEGPFQRSDVRNANKRIYARKIWERLIGDKKSSVMKNVAERGMLGHVEHPKDGRTDGKEGALLTTSLALREDGVVWGKAELLNTPGGRILQEYTRKRIKWGVSSRGHGSVKDDGNVNEEDYMLETFDGVMKPSTPGAHPKPVTSGKKESDTASLDGPTLTEDAKAVISEVEQLREKDVKSLDEAGRSALHKDLLTSMLRVSSLVKSDALETKKANDLQDWLATKMREISEVTAVDADAVIDQALDDLSGDDGDEKHEAFRRVIESMHRRIIAAQKEAESLRARVKESRTEAEEAQAEKAAAIEMLREAQEEQEAAQEQVEKLQEQLDAAYALIAEHTREEVKDRVAEAINSAVEQVPGLDQYREVLESADTPERVTELAEELLPAVVSQKDPEPESPAESIQSRPTLPTGVVESEVVGAGRKPAVSASKGAQRAGRALQRMAAVK